MASIVFTADPTDPRSISARFRARRNIALRAFIAEARKNVSGPFRILDIGGRPDYWNKVGRDFLNEQDLRITCSNFEEFELKRGEESGRVELALGNACSLPYEDGAFHMVHSNSTVEHVGFFANMIDFAREAKRLAPVYWIQTPYYWFPIDPHFYRLPMMHWIPVPIQAEIISRFKIGHSAPSKDFAVTMHRVESRAILTRRQFRYLFPEAEHRFERVLGIPKSMIAVRVA